MKKRNLVLATLVPLLAAGGAVADEMPEMRVWSAEIVAPTEEEMSSTSLQIVASASTDGSNGMVIESVGLVTSKTSEGEDGTSMTEVVASVLCDGPFMVEGGMFTVEAAMMEEEMEEEKAEMAEADEAEDAGCAFSVAGSVKNTYRAWASWDVSGTVTMGESQAEFDIASPMAAMVVEPAMEEEEMEDEEEMGDKEST